MVFFVCEACNETLKKNQVDKHTYSCRQCHAVTCVDCQVTFYGNDYAAHTTCISEAEKYEKSLYKPKSTTKPKAQDLWTQLVEEIVSMSASAPASVKPYLDRLSQLGNVPRNKKKFINFAKNSLKLYKDSVLEELWDFLDKCRVEKEAEYKTEEPAAPAPAETPKEEPKPVVEEVKEESKKDKKRKREEEEKETKETVVEEESKEKKKKKKSKDAEKESVAEVSTEEVKEKKSKKEKKEKKDKKDKS